MQPQSFLRRNALDLVFTLAVLAGSILLFSLEIASPERTQLNDALFGALEFILVLAAGLLIQRVASREEFQRSLKQYALSAFRRISDIKRSTDHLRSQLDRVRAQYSRDRTSDLDGVSAVVSELATTVNSSVLDWIDIIGEEIVSFERAQVLQHKITSAPPPRGATDNETRTRLDALQKELTSLRSELPLVFQAALQTEILPREGRFSPIVYAHYAEMVRQSGFITLQVSIFLEADENLEDRLRTQVPYRLWDDSGMSKFRVGLAFATGEWIGPIENPFVFTDIYENDFYTTLYDLLPIGHDSPAPGERPSVELPGSEFAGFVPNQASFYVRVPIESGQLPPPSDFSAPGAG